MVHIMIRDNPAPMTTPSPTDFDLPPLQTTPPGLYQHYKGGWYEVQDTVRCSETRQGMTLYRALYGDFGLWVRPAAMFSEEGVFQGKAQARFVRHDITQLVPTDLPTALSMEAYLRAQALRQGVDLDTVFRPPPSAPNSCCGRGCEGCVWGYYFTAVQQWRDEVCKLLATPPAQTVV